jgi:DNA invertase Pin-like site-specific DNA recombinase
MIFGCCPFKLASTLSAAKTGAGQFVASSPSNLNRYGSKTKSTDFPRLAKAKAAADYKGRPPSIDATKVRELKQKGLGASEIAKALKIGRASVYRALLTVP